MAVTPEKGFEHEKIFYVTYVRFSTGSFVLFWRVRFSITVEEFDDQHSPLEAHQNELPSRFLKTKNKL